jgi:hypothetical protein
LSPGLWYWNCVCYSVQHFALLQCMNVQWEKLFPVKFLSVFHYGIHLAAFFVSKSHLEGA